MGEKGDSKHVDKMQVVAEESSMDRVRDEDKNVKRESDRKKNPAYAAPDGLEKVQLVVKWGGEVRLSFLVLISLTSSS